MAQYDSTAAEVSEQIGTSLSSPNLQSAVSQLLASFGENVSVQNDINSAADAQSSDSGVLFMNLDEGERGTKETPPPV